MGFRMGGRTRFVGDFFHPTPSFLWKANGCPNIAVGASLSPDYILTDFDAVFKATPLGPRPRCRCLNPILTGGATGGIDIHGIKPGFAG